MGCNWRKAIQSHYEKFLPEIPGTHQINLRRIELSLKLYSGFELVYQPSYYQI